MKSIGAEFDISIRVKPELPWLRMVDLTARSYLTTRSFPRKQIEQTSAAILEAAEQLIALCVEKDVVRPFEVGFTWEDEIVQVHFVYDAAIPLNPHEEPNYEVPSAGKETGDTLEGLWLHIIKRTMDRVFFRIDGKRASLVMMKYCRAEQQARQLWFMGLTPKLRADLAIERQAGESGNPQSGDAIIHDTRSQKVIKLSSSDTFIISRLDGKSTLEDIYLEHAVERGLISPEASSVSTRRWKLPACWRAQPTRQREKIDGSAGFHLCSASPDPTQQSPGFTGTRASCSIPSA